MNVSCWRTSAKTVSRSALDIASRQRQKFSPPGSPWSLYRSLHQTPWIAAKADKHKNVKWDDDLDAKDRRADKFTANLVPGSQQILTGENQAEYEKAEEKMKSAVEWFRKQVATMETRGSGRVTPDLVNSVMVNLPGARGSTKLNDMATIGVREGTTLIITVFEEGHLKHVEKALYIAQIPHVVPQKLDNMTLQIPMPKPTVEGRLSLVTAASKQAEETRVQLRNLEQVGVKKGKYDKRSRELELFRKLLEKHLKHVDDIMADMRKKMGAK